MGEYEKQAGLIGALAETIHDNMWADQILERCALMEEAIARLREAARKRQGGER